MQPIFKGKKICVSKKSIIFSSLGIDNFFISNCYIHETMRVMQFLDPHQNLKRYQICEKFNIYFFDKCPHFMNPWIQIMSFIGPVYLLWLSVDKRIFEKISNKNPENWGILGVFKNHLIKKSNILILVFNSA